jgi:thiol-disulfide isomerase/thioredoxin/DNA-binding beta-propeller fold protein YncE
MVRVRSPELPQNLPWLNSQYALSLATLKGRVVLLDFWTYCCINCLHVLPDLKYLEQKYRNSLAIIGVHSAKFDNEKNLESLRQAILRYDIEHPVLVDSNFKVWDQYAVRSYPTVVVIDPEGYVVGTVSGEGQRDVLDELIAKLLQTHSPQGISRDQDLKLILEKQQRLSEFPLAFPGKVLAISDHLFISDSGHHRIVVSTINGQVLHTIGTGSAGLVDGAFDYAQFSAPQGLAFDQAHQWLYIADTDNHAIRRIDLVKQTVVTIAGTGKQSHLLYPHCGKALETPLNSPWDLVLVEDELLIAMAGSHQIWQVQLDLGTVMTYAGTGAEGCVDGDTSITALAQPSGLSTNGKELFVADSETSSIRAIRLDNSQVRTVCGSGDLYGFGDRDGTGEQVRLQHCLGVDYAQNGLWVADTYNHKIKCIDVINNSCHTVLGDGQAGFNNGTGQTAQFFEPSGISATSTHLYIADTNNHSIRQVNLTTLAVSTIELFGLCSPGICML